MNPAASGVTGGRFACWFKTLRHFSGAGTAPKKSEVSWRHYSDAPTAETVFFTRRDLGHFWTILGRSPDGPGETALQGRSRQDSAVLPRTLPRTDGPVLQAAPRDGRSSTPGRSRRDGRSRVPGRSPGTDGPALSTTRSSPISERTTEPLSKTSGDDRPAGSGGGPGHQGGAP